MAGLPPTTTGTTNGPAASGNTASGNTGLATTSQLQSFVPAQIDPNQNTAYMAYYQQLMDQSLQPTFQQQDQSLQDQLAARGISSSGAAADLTNQLYQTQGATVAGANAPIVSQGYGYTQQDLQGNQGYYNNYLSTLENQGYNTGNEGYTAYLNSFGPNTGVQSLEGTGLSGAQSAYGNVYGAATQGQGSALGGIGTGLGTFAGDALEAGAVA